VFYVVERCVLTDIKRILLLLLLLLLILFRDADAPMAPHVNRLRREDLYQYLLQRLSPVINNIVEEMERNNLLSQQDIESINRQQTPADSTRMLVAVLETKPQAIYDGFIQTLATLHYDDILARVNDDNAH